MKKLILLIVVILVLITGCDKKPDTSLTEKDFHKGTEGLALTMESNMYEMYEESPFQVTVDVHNQGAYNIMNGYLTMSIEEDYMCFRDDSYSAGCSTNKATTDTIATINEPLKGRSIYSPRGDFRKKIIYLKSKNIDPQSERHKSTVIATACYDYRTDIAEDVCIDTDPFSFSPVKKTCEAEDITLKDQGAPIAITKIEVKMLPDGEDNIKPQFIIHVQNKGNGKAVDMYEIEKACTDKPLKSKEWNRVYLDNIEFLGGDFSYDYNKKEGENEIECYPNPLILKKEKDYIRCTLKDKNNLGDEGITKDYHTFLTQLYIRLKYGYTVSESKEFLIQKTY